jgi:hypothetical protein
VFEDAFSFHGIGWGTFDGPVLHIIGEGTSDHGFADAVEDASKELFSALDGERLASGDDFGFGSDTVGFSDGHKHDLFVAKADDFGFDVGVSVVSDDHHITDPNAADDGFDDEADDFGDAATCCDGGGFFEARDVLAKVDLGRESFEFCLKGRSHPGWLHTAAFF